MIRSRRARLRCRTNSSCDSSLVAVLYEKIATLGDEIAKVREAQGAMVKTLREIQFSLHRQQNPGKKRPVQHDGDLVFSGD